MLKKLLTAAVVGAIAKVVLERLKGASDDADLWAEATDSIDPNG